MKTKVIFLALLLGVQFTASAQWTDTWHNNNTYLQGGCFATGADTCFVSGMQGRIYRTLNGGTTWDSSQTIFTTSWFNDMQFPTTTVGYACGGTAFGTHSSIIAKTTNGGVTWDSLTSNTFNYEFYCMSAPDENTGYFAGFDLIKTTNGGQTFTTVPVVSGFGMFTAIKFFTPDTGLLAVRGTDFAPFGPVIKILRTENGGASWTTVFADSSAPGQSAKAINAIAFRDQLNGVAVGDNGRILRTTDGGLNWSLHFVAADTFHLTDVTFVPNSLTGFISAQKYEGFQIFGRIYKTTDGGVTWQHDFQVLEPIASISANGNNAYASSSYSVFSRGNVNSISEKADTDLPFAIYPNPARDYVTLNFTEAGSEQFTIQVTDLQGRLLVQKTVPAHGKNILELPLKNMPAGLYSVKIISDKSIWTEKLIIK